MGFRTAASPLVIAGTVQGVGYIFPRIMLFKMRGDSQLLAQTLAIGIPAWLEGRHCDNSTCGDLRLTKAFVSLSRTSLFSRRL